MRRCLIPVLVTCMAIAVDVTGYRFLVERHSGRARGAGEYFHYRDCGHSWEVYLFIPAAYCEAQLIQSYPKAFLSTPSWSAIPQRLIIRVPDNSITFSFPPWSKNTRRPNQAMQPTHVYEVRPRKDKRGVDLISDALPFSVLWYAGPNAVANAVGYAEHRSRSHDAVIHVYDEAGNVIETHEHTGDFKDP